MEQEDLLAADLATKSLLRKLCASLLSDQQVIAEPEERARALSRLQDTAYSVLLGLHPDVAPPYVPPGEREALAAGGLAAAARALQQEGYPSLAHDLTEAVTKLKSCDTFPLLGSIIEAETGTVPALPLREHGALLSFLLALRGTQPSLRQQRFTFQHSSGSLLAMQPEVDAAETGIFGVAPQWAAGVAAPGAAAPATPPLLLMPPALAPAPVLTSAVFEEAPDPNALADGSSAVAVLLPSELGLPVHALAGMDEVQDLASGLGSRPVWDPASAAALPPLRAPAWLPVPASLLQLRGDPRRGARPAPLGLPLSLLSMGDEPGSSTVFAAGATEAHSWASDGDAASADSVQPVTEGQSGAGSGTAGTAGTAALPQQLDLSVKLWGVAEAELAQHALLVLQGVAASLYRLQALLAAPGALPRRSVQQLVRRLAAAGELRQRLQRFVSAFTSSGGHAAAAARVERQTDDGSSSAAAAQGRDPVQHAFAVAVAEVLRRQSAALQQLEQQQGVAWVQTLAVGSTRSHQLHSRAPTLLQVGLHTGRLQLQLRRLAELCWCIPAGGGTSADEEGDLTRQAGLACGAGNDGDAACRWQEGGFPAGTALLGYLYSRASEADSADAPMLRFLLVQALQPYLRHLHSWAFTTQAVSPEFGTAGDKELVTLEFAPPEERGDEALVPVDPPPFLQPLHAALMRAGSQLRLLHSLEPQGRQLAQRLAEVAEQEMAQRWQQAQRGHLGRVGSTQPAAGAVHSIASFSAVPDTPAAVSGAQGMDSHDGGSQEREPWLSLTGAAAAPAAGAAAGGSQDLQLSSGALQQAVLISEQQDAIRAAAVDGWLAQMALQRRLAERAALMEQQTRAAAQREAQAQRDAQAAAALSRQQSSKAARLREQRAAAQEQRARQAMQHDRDAAADRQAQLAAAQQDHAAAVAELQRALGRTAQGSQALPGSTQQHLAVNPAPEPQAAPIAAMQTVQQATGSAADAASAPSAALAEQLGAALPLATQDQEQPKEAPPAAAGPAQVRLPPNLPPLRLPSKAAAHSQQALQQEQENTRAWQPGSAAAPARGALLPSARQPALLGLPPPTSVPATSRQLPSIAPPLPGGWGVAPAALAAAAAEGEGQNEPDQEDAPAPLSAVLECCVSQSVLSQYRAVSRACVRLFLDELKVLEHLEALRRFFFMGAGDWADALVARLGAHADALAPLGYHQLGAALAEAARGTSVESDPYAAHLRIRLLPAASSTIAAQVGAISAATPTRRARSFWNSNTTVTLAPTQLDALDCVRLDYRVGWPLSAVLTEDTLSGYAAVFSMMARVRRLAQLLRGLHAPLAHQPQSSADVLLSEGDEDKAHRRIQRLRAFHFGAAQFVAALQAFLHARTAGDAWVHLLAKLMVSSEEVAATLVSREPSAPMTGLLSRMNSLGPTGKAAHKLAQSMSRALSASQPASPSAASAGGGGSGGQLARFNSLLSAASAASSAAPSAATSPRPAPLPTARQLSRFAAAGKASGAANTTATLTAAAAAAEAFQAAPPSSRRWPAASALDSPTAATVGQLSRFNSSASALLSLAAAEAAAGEPGAGGPDAAAWARSFQQAQQGIADLQELLDLHRRYVRQASEDCLTFGGSPEAQDALAGVLQCLLGFAFALRGAVQRGGGSRGEEAWAQSLRLDATWRPLAAAMADFEARVQQLLRLLESASSRSVLSELLVQLDFSGFYRRRGEEREERRWRERGAAPRVTLHGTLRGTGSGRGGA